MGQRHRRQHRRHRGSVASIGFAITSNQRIVNPLTERGTVDHEFLGVSIQPIDPDLAKALKLDDTRSGAGRRGRARASPGGRGQRGVAAKCCTNYGKEVGKPSRLGRLRRGPPRPARAPSSCSGAMASAETGLFAVGWMPGKETASNKQAAAGPNRWPSASSAALAPLAADTRDQLNLDRKVEGVVVTQVQPDSPADRRCRRRHHHECQPEGGRRPRRCRTRSRRPARPATRRS